MRKKKKKKERKERNAASYKRKRTLSAIQTSTKLLLNKIIFGQNF